MGTWNTNEVISWEIDKELIGTSKLVSTKIYYPDENFDKDNAKLVFRGDKWNDMYNLKNKLNLLCQNR